MALPLSHAGSGTGEDRNPVREEDVPHDLERVDLQLWVPFFEAVCEQCQILLRQ